jgi:hypothetical protein
MRAVLRQAASPVSRRCDVPENVGRPGMVTMKRPPDAATKSRRSRSQAAESGNGTCSSHMVARARNAAEQHGAKRV